MKQLLIMTMAFLGVWSLAGFAQGDRGTESMITDTEAKEFLIQKFPAHFRRLGTTRVDGHVFNCEVRIWHSAESSIQVEVVSMANPLEPSHKYTENKSAYFQGHNKFSDVKRVLRVQNGKKTSFYLDTPGLTPSTGAMSVIEGDDEVTFETKEEERTYSCTLPRSGEQPSLYY